MASTLGRIILLATDPSSAYAVALPIETYRVALRRLSVSVLVQVLPVQIFLVSPDGSVVSSTVEELSQYI